MSKCFYLKCKEESGEYIYCSELCNQNDFRRNLGLEELKREKKLAKFPWSKNSKLYPYEPQQTQIN